MLCGQTLGAVLGDVIGVRYGRGLRRRRRRAVVHLVVVVGRLDVDGGLPVEVQVPQRRRSHVMRRRRHFAVGRDAGFGFHDVAGKSAAEVAEPAQDAVVHVAVHVLYHRDLVDLKGGGEKEKEKPLTNRLTKLGNRSASHTTLIGAAGALRGWREGRGQPGRSSGSARGPGRLQKRPAKLVDRYRISKRGYCFFQI